MKSIKFKLFIERVFLLKSASEEERNRRDWQLLIRSHEIFDWIFDEFPSLGRKGILFLTYKITLEIKRKIRFHLTYNWVGELSPPL